MFGLAAGGGCAGQDARGFGLTDALAGVGLDGFGSREAGWLAFRHGWNEYGMKRQVSGFRGLVSVLVRERVSRSQAKVIAGRLRHYTREERQRGVERMEEREFFNETTEQRTHSLICPKCGQAAEYKVTWVVRRKKKEIPRGAGERERARFVKAQSYMVRRDDKLQCANVRCRKPFEITTLQSLAFLTE